MTFSFKLKDGDPVHKAVKGNENFLTFSWDKWVIIKDKIKLEAAEREAKASLETEDWLAAKTSDDKEAMATKISWWSSSLLVVASCVHKRLDLIRALDKLTN